CWGQVGTGSGDDWGSSGTEVGRLFKSEVGCGVAPKGETGSELLVGEVGLFWLSIRAEFRYC
ncbi:MAG: hypothetical protein ACD_32C00108G0001, partial [uncultured bacterium]